jgi:hypothetical protein
MTQQSVVRFQLSCLFHVPFLTAAVSCLLSAVLLRASRLPLLFNPAYPSQPHTRARRTSIATSTRAWMTQTHTSHCWPIATTCMQQTPCASSVVLPAMKALCVKHPTVTAVTCLVMRRGTAGAPAAPAGVTTTHPQAPAAGSHAARSASYGGMRAGTAPCSSAPSASGTGTQGMTARAIAATATCPGTTPRRARHLASAARCVGSRVTLGSSAPHTHALPAVRCAAAAAGSLAAAARGVAGSMGQAGRSLHSGTTEGGFRFGCQQQRQAAGSYGTNAALRCFSGPQQ